MLTVRRLALVLAVALATGSAVAADAPRLPWTPTGWRALWSMPANVEDPAAVENLRYGVSGEALAVATPQGTVSVHDPLTGRRRYSIPADPGGSAPITDVWVAAGTIIVSREVSGVAGHLVSGHELATGAPLWRRTVTTSAEGPAEAGSRHLGLSIMVTEGGVTVHDRQADPVTLTTLDLWTGRPTARTTHPRHCDPHGDATSQAIMLLSSCAGNRIELSSVDPRTLRPRWTRSIPFPVSLPSETEAESSPRLGLTAGADGYVYVQVGDVEAFYSPEGLRLSTAREAVERRPPTRATEPEHWSHPLFIGGYPSISDRGFLDVRSGDWPMPAFLISLNTVTGSLSGLPVDTPRSRAVLMGTAPGMAFVYDRAGRIVAYQAVHGPSSATAPFGDVPLAAWPDACALLTGRDVDVAGDGYRPNPGMRTLAGVTSPKPVACDWIPPTGEEAVVSVLVDWVFPSPAAARKAFGTEVAQIKESGVYDPAYESPHAITHTPQVPGRSLDESIVIAGPVLVRLRSTSRQAVRRLTPLLQRNLLARYQPGAAVPGDGPRRTRHAGWSFPSDGSVDDLVLAGGTVYAGSFDGNVYALDAASGARRWSHQSGNTISYLAVTGGVVYAGNNAGRIVSLDAASGRSRWSRRVEAWSSIVLAAGTVYACGRNSEILALDAATGRPRWRAKVGGDIRFSTPSVAGDTVHIGSSDGTVYALDTASGKRRWRFRAAKGTSFLNLVTSGTTIYVPTENGHLHALDRATGRPRWSFPAGGRITAGPVVSGGAVYVGGGDGVLHKLDAATGRKSWDFAPGSANGIYGGLVVDRGTVYLRHVNGRLYALDAASGMRRWDFPAGDGVRARPLVARGVVYVGNVAGHLHALDAATGTARWTYRTGGQIRTTPLTAGGLVYVGSTIGEVSAIRVTDGTAGG